MMSLTHLHQTRDDPCLSMMHPLAFCNVTPRAVCLVILNVRLIQKDWSLNSRGVGHG